MTYFVYEYDIPWPWYNSIRKKEQKNNADTFKTEVMSIYQNYEDLILIHIRDIMCHNKIISQRAI